MLIPVIGVTIRFAAKPFVEALLKLGVGNVFDPARIAANGASADAARDVAMLQRRLLELEQEVAKLKGLPARGEVVAIADVTGVENRGELHRIR